MNKKYSLYKKIPSSTTGTYHRAKKSLGQNFLKNKNVIRDIVSAAEVSPEDIILEIGPGKGILTEELLKTAGRVVAVEKDDELYEKLKEKFLKEIKNKKLELIHADILEQDFFDLKKYKLVANIPYNITGEIIRKFLSGGYQPETIVLLLQKEVAERIVARDGKESILSMSIKVYGEPKYIKKVRAENFSPQPKVDSAILLIKNISKDFFKQENSILDESFFFKVLKTGFSQKRKKLSNTLKGVFGEKTIEILSRTGVDGSLRAEKLKIDDWKKLVILGKNN